VSGSQVGQEPPLVLDTGLFEDAKTLSEALQSLEIPACHRKLDPAIMTDGDWDEILSLVLSTKRVITI